VQNVRGVATSSRVPCATFAKCGRRAGCVAVGLLWAVAVVGSYIKTSKKWSKENRNIPPRNKKKSFSFLPLSCRTYI